jgi:superfamily I DNA and/or RNA helicase
LDNTAKVDAILNAWFDYIALDDYSNARIDPAKQDKVKQRAIGLVGDSVLIEQAIFEELQQKVNPRQQYQQEPVWVLSFPQFLDVEKGKSYLCPLFNLEVTSILKGEYREEGWNLDELKLTEAGENVTTFLGLDEEEREDLITQDGLRQFLETTFKFEFQTYEEWMQQVSLPRRQIKRQPYLFEFPGGRFSKNLKQDLKEIESGSKDWSIGHPAYEYLFGAPQPPKHEVIYMGVFPTHAPTNSQLTALKHAQSEPVTAVQGPPGSGKTTLILHLIAQQVVNRALKLIDGEEDINNLTVVSSTNNKAVDNVIEKLDDWLKNSSLEHNFFYIKGGNQENIKSPGGASAQLQKGIEYLEKNSFNETHFDYLKQRIKEIKCHILDNELNYLEARRQRDLDEKRLPHLQEKVQMQVSLQAISEDIASTEQQKYEADRELTSLENCLATPREDFYASFHQNFHEQHQELFKLSREFLTQQALQDKDNIKKALKSYLDCISRNSPTPQMFPQNQDESFKAISLIFPVITCGLLSVRNMLPRVSMCVDRTIVDEAGMILQHQTFPLLARSRKAIIVGDPLQIEPIIPLSKERRNDYYQTAFINKKLAEIDYHRYSPEQTDKATTYHRAAGATGENGNTGNGIRLMEHYGCQPSIIEYCNNIAKYGLEVKTIQKPSLLEYNLIAHHVEGNLEGKVNQEEVTAILDLIPGLLSKGYSIADIGVISPFKVHADALRDQLRIKFPDFKENDMGTIHTFQCSQKRVMILSTKVCNSHDKFMFITERLNLLNVAVSRAQELFILVGNLYRLEKAGGYTCQLVKHIQNKGRVFDYKSQSEIENPYQSSATDIVFDCRHLEYFKKAIDEVEQELIIVTPWLRGEEPKQFADNIISVLERGVQVKVVYGYLNSDRERYANNDDNDAEAEKKLRDLLGSHLIRSQTRGTNQRILLWDNKFAVVGSWNWLSHRYRDYCNKSSINLDAQIRRETSVFLCESSNIALLKDEINGFLQEEG